MERDRELSLLRQAHFEGFLDCREAKVLDRNWWRKLTWALAWVERRNRNEIRRLAHEHNAALLDYSTDEKSLDMHWEQSLDIQKRYSKAIMPWEKHSKKLSRKQFNSMLELWESVWGSTKDPAVQERINWTVEQMNRMAAQGVASDAAAQGK